MDEENSLERLFYEALDLGPDERHAYVMQKCGEEGRRNQILRLLDAATYIKSQDQLQPGQRVGSYVIVREIGQGGMGTVYLAEQPLLGRLVALKMIRRDRETTSVIERFLIEQHALAQLTHPNIATIFEAGSTEDGQPFFAMEYVDGEPIDLYCDKHRLRIEERLRLFRDLCAAVHFAHVHTVIHRDVKPGNILVTSSGEVKLLDFGLAKFMTTSQLGETVSSGWFTPSFASPEQIRGETLTLQSDGFSLGVVLYSLLTGSLPFAGKTNGQIEQHILEKDPFAPSVRVIHAEMDGPGKLESNASARQASPKQLSRMLRADLDNIVLKSLDKVPARRYPSADQLSEDVQRFLDHMPVVAHAPSVSYRIAKFVRRHRWSVTAAACFLAVLIVSSISIAWQGRIARVERARADRRFNDVRRLANSFLFEFDRAIQDVPGTTAAQHLVVSRALEYLDSLSRESSDQQLTKELATSYERVGDVEGEPFGQSLGEPEAALESYRKAQGLRMNLPTTVDSQFELAGNHLKIADIEWVQQKWDDARHDYDLARQLDELALRMAPSRIDIRKQLSVIYTGLGDTAQEVDDLNAAKRLHQMSLEIRNTLANSGGAEEKRSLAVGFIKLGDVAGETGDVSGAITQFQAALRIFRELASKDPHNEQYRSNMVASLNRLGLAQRKNGQAKLAADSQKAAFDLATAAYREDRSNATAKRNLASTESLLGDALLDTGLKNEAIAHLRNHLRFQKELEAIDKTNEQTRRDVWIATYQLGRTLLDTGKVSEARIMLEDSLKQAMEIAQEMPKDSRPIDDLVDARVAFAHALRSSSDWQGAVRQLDLAVPAAHKLALEFPTKTDFSSRLAYALTELAKTHELAAIRTPAQARVHLRQARDAWRQSLAICDSMNQKGLLSMRDQSMLIEARQKSR